MRELTFSTLVLGTYEPYKKMLGAKSPDSPLYLQAAAGALAGMTGALPTSPTDLLKVRMQADTGAPKQLRHHIAQVYKMSGVLGFYTGLKETVMFAAIRRSSQLASYDQCKHRLIRHGYMQEGLLVHAVSAVIAGFATSVVTSPVDLIRTRLMNFKQGGP